MKSLCATHTPIGPGMERARAFPWNPRCNRVSTSNIAGLSGCCCNSELKVHVSISPCVNHPPPPLSLLYPRTVPLSMNIHRATNFYIQHPPAKCTWIYLRSILSEENWPGRARARAFCSRCCTLGDIMRRASSTIYIVDYGFFNPHSSFSLCLCMRL